MKKTLTQILVLIALTVGGCKPSGQPSDSQIESAKTTVSNIRASLYTPAHAKLLNEKLYYGANPEDYPGCVSGHIYMAYHSPLRFDEILEDYRQGLKAMGWEPSPDYAHDRKDIDIFQSGSQTLMGIALSPLREDLLVVPTPTDPSEQKGTIYYISLTYYDPSIHECSE